MDGYQIALRYQRQGISDSMKSCFPARGQDMRNVKMELLADTFPVHLKILLQAHNDLHFPFITMEKINGVHQQGPVPEIEKLLRHFPSESHSLTSCHDYNCFMHILSEMK